MKAEIDKIEEHLANAEERHPHFADELIYTHRNRDANLRNARLVLQGENDYPTHFFAESILDCELAEIYEAYAYGRHADAIEECYDAIAVLLRMVNMIENEMKRR